MRDTTPARPMNKLAFAGTPSFAAHILERLLVGGYRPELVLTQPDRRRGRGRKLTPSAVQQTARAAGLPTETPARAVDIEPALVSAQVDVLLVVAYGLILPASALAQPRLGCINVHASLLPRWRGAAPIERAMLAGDTETGISIMQMDEGLDTGPVFRQARLSIGAHSTGFQLESALAELGAELLLGVLPDIETLRPAPQVGAASYAPKLGRNDSVPDWRRPADQLGRQIRALAHRVPVTATLEGARVKILAATPRERRDEAEPGTLLESAKHRILVACGSGALELDFLKINRGQGRTLAAADARNGFPGLFFAGARFQ